MIPITIRMLIRSFLLRLFLSLSMKYSYIEFVTQEQLNKSEMTVYSLLRAADALITDYSSVVFDYALLEKPMIFFAYDLDEFKQKSREFYYGYEEFIPDKCVQKTEEVVEKIKSFETNLDNETLERIKIFSKEFCEFRDGKSSERFVKRFLT